MGRESRWTPAGKLWNDLGGAAIAGSFSDVEGTGGMLSLANLSLFSLDSLSFTRKSIQRSVNDWGMN